MLVVPWQKFTDLAPWLYAADVLAIPPSLKPLHRHGNTVLPIKLFLYRYLAVGRVILAPVAPDTAELLADGVNAALVPAGDVAAMVRTLRALAADPARAARLAAGSLRTAQGLTWDARAELIERFLLARLAATGPDPPAADSWTRRRWAGEVWRWLIRPRPV